jgi:hypothetical protein
MMELIDGHAGVSHVDSQDVADSNIALFGPSDYVLPVGAMFSYQQVSVNLVNLNDGVSLMQGRRAIIPAGRQEPLTIENGTSGATRRDLIVLRYERDTATGIETVKAMVIKGTDNRQEDPANYSGTVVRDGAPIHDMLLYRVNISTTGGVTLEKLFSTLPQIYLPGNIGPDNIANAAITSAKLAPGAALANIANASITSAKLAPDAALGNIADGSIESVKLATGAALANIANGSISAAKLAAGAASGNLGISSVDWSRIIWQGQWVAVQPFLSTGIDSSYTYVYKEGKWVTLSCYAHLSASTPFSINSPLYELPPIHRPSLRHIAPAYAGPSRVASVAIESSGQVYPTGTVGQQQGDFILFLVTYPAAAL